MHMIVIIVDRKSAGKAGHDFAQVNASVDEALQAASSWANSELERHKYKLVNAWLRGWNDGIDDE